MKAHIFIKGKYITSVSIQVTDNDFIIEDFSDKIDSQGFGNLYPEFDSIIYHCLIDGYKSGLFYDQSYDGLDYRIWFTSDEDIYTEICEKNEIRQ